MSMGNSSDPIEAMASRRSRQALGKPERIRCEVSGSQQTSQGANTRSGALLDYAEKQSTLARPQMVHYYKLLVTLSEAKARDRQLSKLKRDLSKVSSTIRAEERRTRYSVSSCRGSHAPRAGQLCKLNMKRSKLRSKKAAREKALRASIVRM